MAISTTVSSNAFNFLNFIQSQVDPRTGQYTCAITLPELKANHLCGPVVPLQLNFNPLNNSDSGFGIGWNLQLSQYNPNSRVLSLYTGETFKVNLEETPEGIGKFIPEKKIDSFHFYILDDKHYRIEHKSGLIEILEVGQGGLAMPVQMLSPQGHSVTLQYTPFFTEPLLSSIKNADGTELISLVRTNNELKILLHPGTMYEAEFKLEIIGSETRTIVLPTDDNASWRFAYGPYNDLTCLTSVDTPTGGHETITYSAAGHSFPGLSGRKLPRVEIHKRDPGFDQPVSETRYEYDLQDRNFLGFGSGIAWSDDGLDNLYKISADYQYETTENVWDATRNQTVRSTHRVFNKYHLLVREQITQKAEAGSEDTLSVTETEYYIDPQKNFKDQPAYCQLPKTVTKIWRNANATEPRHTETVTATYDDYGNLLTQTNANGVIETNTWYSRDGEADSAEGHYGCPADPQKFVRSLKSKTVTPAASGFGSAPTLQTRYRYDKYLELSGSGIWIALHKETLVQVLDGLAPTELRRLTHEYINTPDDAQRHGRLSKMQQTLNNQAETLSTTTYDYDITPNIRAGVMAMRTVSTMIGFDDIPDDPENLVAPSAQVRKVITEEHSTLDGAKLSSRDDNDSHAIYQYDLLGRVIQETAAPDTQYQATRTYRYALTNGAPGQQAVQYTTDIQGVETRTWLDGFNRVLKEERQDADALGGDPELFRSTYSAVYNHLGQLTRETTIDWEAVKNVSLSSTYEYDAWGEQFKVVGPDGVAQITENNQAEHTLTRWAQSAGAEPKIIGKSRVTLNLFDKEDKIETLDANGKTMSTIELRYDGLGNCVEQIDDMGEITRFVYDSFSRLQITVLPDYTEIHRAYASHSIQELPVSLEVVANQKTQLIGTQTFDGLDRRKTLKVGPRFQEYFYVGGQTQVSNMLTAGKNILTYTYEPGLVDTPTIITADGEESRFDYDRRSAQLTSSTNVAGLHEFAYNNNGQVLSERWTEQGTSKQWETQYTQTLNGRPLTRVQINGLDCTYTYDDKARIDSVEQGDILATIGYDELGQVCTVSAQNKANQQTLLTELTYDDQGRETIRKMTLGAGHPTQTITQAYRVDSKLQSRHLQLNDQTELLETFTYDKRGRMVQYNCEGTNLPKDRYGNAIREHVFGFDALDNVTAVYTTFADGSCDDAESTFAANDPCQLVSVTHSHPAYPPVCNLDYDADGNLLHDENGQSLHYDTQGRLLSVNDADGNLVSQYRYDAHNHLLGVKRGTQTETLRFYEDDRLCRTEQGNTKTHYLYLNDQPLGQQEQGSSEHTLLLLSDSKNSVLAESSQNLLRKAIYGAYGERSPDDDLQCLLGFNGEVRDEQSGWYLLGLGYRAYNPTLMRFHSPDSLSPFGAGGINPYVYCAGDPINYVDPTGHANRKTNTKGLLGGILSAIGIALSVAAVVIAPPVGIAAMTSTFVFTGVGIGFGAYGIYEGVMATQATELRKRESHATSSLISGAVDVLFGAFSIYSAIKTAAKLKAKAAAQASYHAGLKRSFENINNLMGGTTQAGRNSGRGTAEASEGVTRSFKDASTQTSRKAPLPPAGQPAAALPSNPGPSRHVQTTQSTVATPYKPREKSQYSWDEFEKVQNNRLQSNYVGENKNVSVKITDPEHPKQRVAQIRAKIRNDIKMQPAAD